MRDISEEGREERGWGGGGLEKIESAARCRGVFFSL